MIKRQLEKIIKKYAKKFPILAIIGPRQSGKTTLAKMAFANYKYISKAKTKWGQEANTPCGIKGLRPLRVQSEALAGFGQNLNLIKKIEKNYS